MSMITNQSKLALILWFVGISAILLINVVSLTAFAAEATIGIKCKEPLKDLITPGGIVCFLPQSSSLPDQPPQKLK